LDIEVVINEGGRIIKYCFLRKDHGNVIYSDNLSFYDVHFFKLALTIIFLNRALISKDADYKMQTSNTETKWGTISE